MITTGLLDKPMYCAETWSLKKVSETKLEASHHRWLGKIVHIFCKDTISNDKIRKHTQQGKLDDVNREWRLCWCGHVWRSHGSLIMAKRLHALTGHRWWSTTSQRRFQLEWSADINGRQKTMKRTHAKRIFRSHSNCQVVVLTYLTWWLCSLVSYVVLILSLIHIWRCRRRG